MKKIHRVAAVVGFLLAGLIARAEEAPAPTVAISDLAVNGKIEGENVSFTLTFQADVKVHGARLTLIEGDVTCLRAVLPKGAELERPGQQYAIRFGRKGAQSVSFEFASLAARDGDWRISRFVIPESNIRRLALVCDRDDLEVDFPGALGVERKKDAGGKTVAQAYLGSAKEFSVRWKPEVKALTGELFVTCDANTIASASVGVLRLDSILTYRIVQGELNRLVLDVPADLNVTQVRGVDIREWSLQPRSDKERQLVVALSRPKESVYQLRVEGERVLPAFPCRFELPVLKPENVIRASGFLMIGTESAIKLLVARTTGLTQVDQAAFPVVRMDNGQKERAVPSRSAYAYQYAGMPYMLELSADDIVTAFTSEERLVLSLTDNDLVLQASVELDVRDAPAREVVLETDPGWVVANVAGNNVADYDVRDQPTNRQVHVYFREASLGRNLFEVRLEKSLAAGAAGFKAPLFRVRDAKAERGYVVLRAEKGVRLKPEQNSGLREVHTGSLPIRIPDAQQAFRFKVTDWTLGVNVEKTTPSIHSEIFHLVTVGESALFGSCSITYHISGAPVRSLKVVVPAACQNVEFAGRDVRGWDKTNDTWQVSLQEKVLGDYTLLVTYDQPFSYLGGEIRVGGIETVGSDSEVGYIVLAGGASLSVEQALQKDASLIEIDRQEIPQAYALLVNDPVIRSYKYVGNPHSAALKVKRYPTQSLLGQVADFTTLSTRLSREGEVVTTAGYYVKNASQQYLSVTLPEGAKLWSALVDGSAVQALEVEGKRGEILVPLHRRRDPNEPSRVEVAYAQIGKPLGFRRVLELQAPVAGAQSVFSKWNVQMPEKFAVAATGGNMLPAQRIEAVGLTGVLGSVLDVYRGFLKRNGPWAFFLLVMVASMSVIARNIARGRVWAWSSVLLLLVGVVVLVATLGLTGGVTRFGLAQAFASLSSPSPDWTFTRPVSLAGSEPTVRLTVVPAWLGSSTSLLWLILGVVAGAPLLFKGIRAKGGAPSALALGLTLLSFGLAAVAAFVPWVFLAIAFGVPLLIAVGCVRAGWRAGRRAAARVATGPVAVEPPPLAGAAAGGAAGYGELRLMAGMALIAITASLALAGAAPVDSKAAKAPVQQPVAVQAAPAQSVAQRTAAVAQAIRLAAPAAIPAGPVMRRAEMKIQGPGTGKDEEQIAKISAEFSFTAKEGESFVVLTPPAVLTQFDLKSRNLSIRNEAEGYVLTARRDGDYSISLTYLMPVRERDGVWSLAFPFPANIENLVTLRLPVAGLDVQSPDAVQLKSREADGATETLLVFGPVPYPAISWAPRERKVKLEKAVVFSDVNTLAVFEPGVATLTHGVRYQIAQGELQSFSMRIPTGMTVTAVSAPGLSTWRFDPETHLLEALLDKPVSGDFVLTVTTQIPQEGVPYDVGVAVPSIENTSRQRGAIAFAAPESVQIRVDNAVGLNSMNVSDFSAADAGMPLQTARLAPVAVKRAFRYQQLPATASVHAERVLPEIRVAEDARLDVSDERTVLSSKLEVTVARSGVFSVRLNIPPDYDVESLTGQDVSHWDEIKDDARGVVVHFDRQVMGTRTINLVISRTEKGVENSIRVPRVTVEGEVKHAGLLGVSGERGVRFTTTTREGVSEVNPSELGINQPGYLAFKLLRPDWAVVLKTEVVAPVVRAEVVQQVKLMEGLLQARCYVEYKIDNAGLKTFLLQAPQPGLALTVSGRNVARVQQTDKEKGIWQVELHNKVETTYALEVSYQAPCDPKAQEARILPLRTIGTESQKGYLVVMANPRLKVKAKTVPDGFKEEDARSIPAQFSAGDLSDAILCYRVTQADYALDLSMVRHGAAGVLPARVSQVRMQSVISDDDQVVTRVLMDMDVGDMRLLKMTMPADGEVWAVFVNGRSTKPLIEAKAQLIPLQGAVSGQSTTVEIIYGSRAKRGFLSSVHRFDGPSFDLPLTDIEWQFYAPPQFRYYAFGGTVNHRSPLRPGRVLMADDRTYLAYNAGEIQRNNEKAKTVLKKGEELARKGQQKEAKQAFESAVYLSQGQADFNEDVRIQYRNLARQQAVLGLVNRRDSLRAAQNVQQEDTGNQAASQAPNRQARAPQGGGWTAADYSQHVEQALPAKDFDSLNTLAEKIIDQQAAAAGIAYPIRITVPLHGRVLEFYRQLQINPGARLEVTFRAFDLARLGWLWTLVAFAGCFVAWRIGAGLALKK